jgi:hypothetical protein
MQGQSEGHINLLRLRAWGHGVSSGSKAANHNGILPEKKQKQYRAAPDVAKAWLSRR